MLTPDLVKRVADCLGWQPSEVQRFSLFALRDLVRPVSPKLAYEIELATHDLTLIGDSS